MRVRAITDLGILVYSSSLPSVAYPDGAGNLRSPCGLGRGTAYGRNRELLLNTVFVAYFGSAQNRAASAGRAEETSSQGGRVRSAIATERERPIGFETRS
jgi:hypothetical protein